MALTCNVEAVCRVRLNAGVWPVDPMRVGSRLNPPKLLCTSVRKTRRRLDWACRSRTAEAILGTWVLPGHLGVLGTLGDIQARLQMA